MIGLDNKTLSYINFLDLDFSRIASEAFLNDDSTQRTIYWNKPNQENI